MQNESKKIKILLLAMLEITFVGNIEINGKSVTSKQRNHVIGILALALGSHLGFTEDELTDPLTEQGNELMHTAANLVSQLVINYKEYL